MHECLGLGVEIRNVEEAVGHAHPVAQDRIYLDVLPHGLRLNEAVNQGDVLRNGRFQRQKAVQEACQHQQQVLPEHHVGQRKNPEAREHADREHPALILGRHKQKRNTGPEEKRHPVGAALRQDQPGKEPQYRGQEKCAPSPGRRSQEKGDTEQRRYHEEGLVGNGAARSNLPHRLGIGQVAAIFEQVTGQYIEPHENDASQDHLEALGVLLNGFADRPVEAQHRQAQPFAHHKGRDGVKQKGDGHGGRDQNQKKQQDALLAPGADILLIQDEPRQKPVPQKGQVIQAVERLPGAESRAEPHDEHEAAHDSGQVEQGVVEQHDQARSTQENERQEGQDIRRRPRNEEQDQEYEPESAPEQEGPPIPQPSIAGAEACYVRGRGHTGSGLCRIAQALCKHGEAAAPPVHDQRKQHRQDKGRQSSGNADDAAFGFELLHRRHGRIHDLERL